MAHFRSAPSGKVRFGMRSDQGHSMQIRSAAMAGRFYPDDPLELQREIAGMLNTAREHRSAATVRPHAVIVPHAGYLYSGPIAASAYCRLELWSHEIRRVLLIGPAHRAPTTGLVMSGADAFSTPLGLVRLDRDACAEAISMPSIVEDDSAHREEHSLEVQLPFLQAVLPDTQIVPVLVGRNATPNDVAGLCDLFLDRDGWVGVISSDLSHFHSAEVCRKLDEQTSHALERLAGDELNGRRACGYIGIGGLLHAAKKRDWRLTTVDLRNSGDTAGPRDSVVGYGAYVVC